MGAEDGGKVGLADPERSWLAAIRDLAATLLTPDLVEVLEPLADPSRSPRTTPIGHRADHGSAADSATLRAASASPETERPSADVVSDTRRSIVLADGSTLAITRASWRPSDLEQLAAVGRMADALIVEQQRSRHAQARLRAAATTLISTDTELRITSVEQLGELEANDDLLTVGSTLSELFDGRDIPELKRRTQLAWTGGDTETTFTIGTLLRHADRFANLTFVPARGAGGELTGFGVQIVDRSREVDLIQRSDRNRRLGAQMIAGAPLGVVVFDRQGRVEHSNEIAHHFLGPVDGLSIDQLDVDAVVVDELQLTFETGEPGAFEWRHPTIALSCTVAPSFDVSELSHVIWYLDPRTDTRNSDANGNLDLELSIREAIEDQTIGLRFQPEFDAKTGEVTAIEALALAYTHNRVMTGDQFIPAAEAAGIVGAVDAAVLGSAIAQAAAWVREGWDDAVVRINVSTTTLRDRTFVERLAAHLVLNDLPGRHICLEITETGVIADPVLAEEAMAAIRALDVTIALDDFGSGQSSLGRLARFGTDVLKLDQSFASQVHQNAQTRTVIDAIVQLAHRLDAIVVAEGVENERQRAALTELGCDRLQGHFLGGPLAIEHIDIRRLTGSPLPAIVGSTTGSIDLRD